MKHYRLTYLFLFLLTTITNFLCAATIDVKKYGAKGDGKSDDAKAITKAIQALKDNDILYFPAGTYIVNNTCLLLRGKKNIQIKGANNKSSIIKPSQQGRSTKKQFYPSTMCIDQCSNVTICGLTIESKGENYGDTDAAVKVALGTPRVDFSVKNGGHALLITRSFNVSCLDLIGRRCGSVGVFYAGSCSDVSFTRCFANAASVGYAGFAVDNWFEPNQKYNRNYRFKDCVIAPEKKISPFSGKAGIIIEGNNNHIINVWANNIQVEGTSGNPNVKFEGFAIGAFDCNLIANNIVGKNNFAGVFLSTRGNVANSTSYSINNCQFVNNKVTGARIKLQGKGPMNVAISNTTFSTNQRSFWPSEDKNFSYANTIGLYFAFHKGSGKKNIELNNVTSTGSYYGLFTGDAFNIKMKDCKISSVNNAVCLNGGTCDIDGGEFESANASVFYLSPNNRTESNKSNGKNYVGINASANKFIASRKDRGEIFEYKGEKSLLKSFQVKSINTTMGKANMLR